VITTDQYAASIVEKYRIIPDTKSASHRAADEVLPLLKKWGKEHLLGLTLSGAYAKNTAITLSSQVDVLIALSPVPGMEMKNIFWSLFKFLSDQDLQPHTRDVSIRLETRGVNVDLIPACRDRETSGNLLFNKRSGKAIHTDVARHVHLVGTSGRQQEICAFKIWRERQSLEFPSLYLEFSVLHALASERFGQLADNILAVLRYLSHRFELAVVPDPANPDNILSNDLSAADKKAIAAAARDALNDENWNEDALVGFSTAAEAAIDLLHLRRGLKPRPFKTTTQNENKSKQKQKREQIKTKTNPEFQHPLRSGVRRLRSYA